MFQDAYGAAFWKAFDPTEMEISFFSQCREGEELTILSREEESAVYLAALHADGKLASAALFNKSHKNYLPLSSCLIAIAKLLCPGMLSFGA